MATTPIPDPKPETPLEQAQRWMTGPVAAVSPGTPRGRRGLQMLLLLVEAGLVATTDRGWLTSLAVVGLVAIMLLIPRPSQESTTPRAPMAPPPAFRRSK